MVCLETDFLVALLRNNAEAASKAEEFIASGEHLCVTPITATELFRGAFLSSKKENIDIVEGLVSRLSLLDYDAKSARKAGELFCELGRLGNPVGEFDTINAAIAMSHGEALLTRNARHYGKIQGLIVKEW